VYLGDSAVARGIDLSWENVFGRLSLAASAVRTSLQHGVVVIPRGCSRFSNRLRRTSTTYTVLSVYIYFFFNNESLPTIVIFQLFRNATVQYAVNNWFYAATEDGSDISI